PDRKGYRRLVHPSGICMTGVWEITEETPYSGYFGKGSRGLIIARYSVSAMETRRGHTRSLSMVGRIYPTADPADPRPLRSASLDFRDEIMAQIHDTPQRSLTFHIETSDTGESFGPDFLKRRKITGWRRVGTIRFDAAVASYNADHVFHVNHVPWRKDRNDPATAKVKRLTGG